MIIPEVSSPGEKIIKEGIKSCPLKDRDCEQDHCEWWVNKAESIFEKGTGRLTGTKDRCAVVAIAFWLPE